MKPRALRDDALSIHGDSLLAEGRAQGTLINLQLARHRSPFARRASAQKESEVKLVAEHRDELLGPLAAIPGVDASWALGFVSRLKVPLRSAEDLEALTEALSEPAFARLERLVLSGDCEDLSGLAEATLHQLELRDVTDWQSAIESLPPVRSLVLRGDDELDFEELALPATEVLRLAVPYENLSLLKAPKLRVLRVVDGAGVNDLPELELVYLDGYLTEDEPPRARRVIQEWQYGNDEGDAGIISRNGRGRFGERAFVLTSAPLVDARKLAGALEGKNFTVAACGVEFGCLPWAAIELRMENATSGELLRNLSTALARAGHRTLEFAVSPSNLEFIAWAIEPERVRPLAMGPAKERDALWRLAIDRALAIDPGDVFDELLLELDASEPQIIGEPPADGSEWPLVTTFTPPERDWDWELEGYDEGEEVDAEPQFDPTDFRDESGPRNWWKPVEVEAPTVDLAPAPAEDEPEEVVEEAPAASEWEVLAESPIDLESDGEERNPEYGLEPDSFDPDSVDATVLTDGVDPAQCEVCEARTTLRPCFSCARRVCSSCWIGEPRATGEVKCTACPAPRPLAPPAPIPELSEEEEEEA